MHREIGKCNSKELYDIIVKINPEIIFEEFDVSRTDDEYYKNGHYKNQAICSLETIAIMRYLENHQIIHIPVDTYDITDIHKEYVDYMYRKISKNSEEYTNLVKMNFILSCQQGFPYLNSLECSDLLQKIRLIEKEVVKSLNDKILLNVYKSWQLVTDSRENEMVKNIYDYSKNHCYNNALFIIGAEHKKSIIDKIQDYERKNEIKLNWNFNL
jgi:hypothetical protein